MIRLLATSAVTTLFLALLTGCGSRSASSEPEYVATIAPLGSILRELVGGRGEVKVLLPPGASPHTYAPRPSDARAAQGCNALFSVSPALDGWAANLPAKNRVVVFPFVDDDAKPMSLSEQDDPHFWSSPEAVKSILPELVDELSRLDPSGRAVYEQNAKRFSYELDRLDAELARTLSPVKGQSAVLFHSSFGYMLDRYGLRIAAVVEPSPGKEPTARDMERVIDQSRAMHARAVFTEPQLPRRPAEVLAESTGLRLGELDPEGGIPGREEYADLMRYNAGELVRCLRP